MMISHASIIVPFLLGAALSLFLYQDLAPQGTSFNAFALFIGVAMSITAFPVLARILGRPQAVANLSRHNRHHLCGNRRCYCLVHPRTRDSARESNRHRDLRDHDRIDTDFCSRNVFCRATSTRSCDQRPRLAVAQTAFGPDHPGVFYGLCADHGNDRHPCSFRRFPGRRGDAAIDGVPGLSQGQARGVWSYALLPLFFAFTGLRTQVGLLNELNDWLMCVVIILVAIAGKLGGSMLMGRWTGMTWSNAFAIGVLMNTRGLVELVVLNIGYDLGILSGRIFAMMVLMALVTTFMTGPLLSLVKTRN